VNRRCRIVLSAVAENGLFHVQGHMLHIKDDPVMNSGVALSARANVWHRRLGHVSFGTLQHMQRHETARNLDVQGAIVHEQCGLVWKESMRVHRSLAVTLLPHVH
jgi:GAG-pre-integrase domain